VEVEMTEAIDRRPLVVCRDHIPDSMIAEVDAWIPKHFDDSLAHPAVTSATSFQAAWGLPATFTEPGCRIIVYVTHDMPQLVEWLDSPELRAAIEDGTEREAQVIPVDGDPFTGNIYDLVEIRGSVGADFIENGGIFLERFEVDSPNRAEFDAWLNGPHLDAIAGVPGAVRVRTWAQNLDVPQRFPYDRYVSRGNRMISADFAAGVDVAGLLGDERIWRAIADSARWDLRLPSVRRDAGTYLVARPPTVA
jgi:hypothetical protein